MFDLYGEKNDKLLKKSFLINLFGQRFFFRGRKCDFKIVVNFRFYIPLITSSKHCGHNLAVTDVVAPKSGLALISINHG